MPQEPASCGRLHWRSYLSRPARVRVRVWMCPMLLCIVSRSGSYGSSCCRSAPVLPQRPRSCGPSCARRLLVAAAIHLLCPSERLALR